MDTKDLNNTQNTYINTMIHALRRSDKKKLSFGFGDLTKEQYDTIERYTYALSDFFEGDDNYAVWCTGSTVVKNELAEEK